MFTFHTVSFVNLKMTGILTMSRWCEAMEAATGLGLPWRLLREKLAPMQLGFPPLDVFYNLTLELLDTDLIVSTRCICCVLASASFGVNCL